MTTSRVRFGAFEFDHDEQQLVREGRPVDLQAQPARLLGLLVRKAGRTVTRAEIQTFLWGAETHVDFDQGINHCIRQIRAALDDAAETPRYIATQPRRGYRFVAPVCPVDRQAATVSRPRWALIAAAIVGLMLVGSLVVGRFGGVAPQGGSRLPVLAILPFHDLGPTGANEYFDDALTEELIAQLGRGYSGRIDVIARTSAMQYKDTDKGIAEIARELGADFLLEGSLRRSGDRVRITAQLIRASDAAHLWASSFDRKIPDVIDVQEEVSLKIARALGVELLPASARGPAAATSPEAYESYLKGKAWSHEFDREEPLRHIAALERAVELDPGFAAAWAALARAYRGQPVLPSISQPRAREAVRTALALDESLPEAHLVEAMIRFYHDWDLEGARESFERALELRPGYAEAWHAYAAYFSVTGDHAGALEAVQRARALDPLSPEVTSDVGWYSYFARQYNDAIDHCRGTLQHMPDFYWGHRCIIFASLQLGDPVTAVSQMRTEMEQRGAPIEELAALDGDTAAALEAYWSWDLRRHDALSEHVHVSPSSYGMVQLARGDHAAALELLERSVDQRSGWILPFLRVDPLVDPLRDEPRFRALMRRIDEQAVLRAAR